LNGSFAVTSLLQSIVTSAARINAALMMLGNIKNVLILAHLLTSSVKLFCLVGPVGVSGSLLYQIPKRITATIIVVTIKNFFISVLYAPAMPLHLFENPAQLRS
jgi:hypothetical protein